MTDSRERTDQRAVAELAVLRASLKDALGMGLDHPDAAVVSAIRRIREDRAEAVAELEALRTRGIVLPEVGADRIVETVTGAINVGASVRQEIVDLLSVWSKPNYSVGDRIEWNPTGDTWESGVVLVHGTRPGSVRIRLDENNEALLVEAKHLRRAGGGS